MARNFSPYVDCRCVLRHKRMRNDIDKYPESFRIVRVNYMLTVHATNSPSRFSQFRLDSLRNLKDWTRICLWSD